VSGVIRAGKTQARHRRRADPLQWDPFLPEDDDCSGCEVALSGANRMDLPFFLVETVFFLAIEFHCFKKKDKKIAGW
jgi:hypothetical protein